MSSYRSTAKSYSPDTVFIGGGTPTMLPEDDMVRLLRAIAGNFHLQKNAEISLEANPGTLTLPMLKRYRRAGINRLSMGLQSSNDKELSSLSRCHTVSEFEKSFRAAREAKITNINVDVMYGIPHQSLRSFMETLKYVVSFNPEHVSLYALKIEDSTPFALRRDSLPLPDDETQYRMYLGAIEYLGKNNYRQYEISNFSRPGFECRHNLKYWNCEEYLGLGAAAHSYFNGARFSFQKDIKLYIKGITEPEAKFTITDENEIILPRERMGEYIMLRMRLCEGIRGHDFFRIFGKDFDRLYGEKMLPYIKNGYVVHIGDAYRFNPSGMFVSNYILSDILDFSADSFTL